MLVLILLPSIPLDKYKHSPHPHTLALDSLDPYTRTLFLLPIQNLIAFNFPKLTYTHTHTHLLPSIQNPINFHFPKIAHTHTCFHRSRTLNFLKIAHTDTYFPRPTAQLPSISQSRITHRHTRAHTLASIDPKTPTAFNIKELPRTCFCGSKTPNYLQFHEQKLHTYTHICLHPSNCLQLPFVRAHTHLLPSVDRAPPPTPTPMLEARCDGGGPVEAEEEGGRGVGLRELARGGCCAVWERPECGHGDGGQGDVGGAAAAGGGRGGEGEGAGGAREEVRGGEVSAAGDGCHAAVAASQPQDCRAGPVGVEDAAGHAAGARVSGELRGGESAAGKRAEPRLGVPALWDDRFPLARGHDGQGESYPAKEEDERLVSPDEVARRLGSKTGFEDGIVKEFAHHKPGLVRLNNGSFGSCPASVLAAQADWCRWWLRQPDECYFGPLEEHLYQARKEVADLIHVPVEEVVLLENVTAAASMVALDVMWAFAEGLFSKGDSILTLNFNYGAVKKAFKAYCLRVGARIFEVTLPFPVRSSEQILQTFEDALKREKAENPTGQIRLAVIDHIVSMPTMILPLCQIVKLCRSYGVQQIFVDGAHGIGNLELDMHEIDADYYTSNLHKWMFAPATAAFFYCKPQHLSRLHHPIISHLYNTGIAAECSWVGTRDYSALVAVPVAINFVKDVAGGSVDAYSARNHQNVVAMAEMLASAWGTYLGTPPEMCAAMAMVALPPDLDINSQAELLRLRKRLREEYHVDIHVYYAGVAKTTLDDNMSPQDTTTVWVNSYVRISHQIFNKTDDFVKLRDAIHDICCKNNQQISVVY